MANPQKENGHTDIANEIVEALARTNLSKYESRYLWVLWRKTYGWHKRSDVISNSQFVKETGIKKQHIWRTEQRLITRNIVTKIGYKLSFQKDYTAWKELPKQVTVTSTGISVTYSGIKVTSTGGHKRNYTKETITKEREEKNTAPPSPLEEMLSLIENPEEQEKAAQAMIYYGFEISVARKEIKRWLLYWTEKTLSGKKMRFETEKTFDPKRRINTWFRNINTYANKK